MKQLVSIMECSPGNKLGVRGANVPPSTLDQLKVVLH